MDNLGLKTRNNRIDLRELISPTLTFIRRISTDRMEGEVFAGRVTVRKARWTGLDFTGSHLNDIGFIDCIFTDCVFDECNCKGWGVWRSLFKDTSFRGADLRGAALGPVLDRERNSFRRVDFSGADLRQTSYDSADFVGCAFNRCKLTKVDFQGSSFTDCVFQGEVREVLFYRHAFRGDSLPPNEMSGVDFGRATLRFVGFRGLNLDGVKFPQGKDHIIIEHYPETLDRLLKLLSQKTGSTSTKLKRLIPYLKDLRKWAGPKQQCGVINRLDLQEFIGEEGVDRLIEMLAS
ncbi:MAG: pentapeptide repeat-containing protein [Alphaproteobacteria bacterium]